jgi:GTP-binding protein
VYILPTPHLTTLSSVPTRVRAPAGGNGSGTWLNGRNAAPTVIRVPVGTVVRELPRDDNRRAKDEWESADEAIEELPAEERANAIRDRRFVHFPRYAEENSKRDIFREAERDVSREEREIRIARRQRSLTPLELDLDRPEETERDPDAPLGVRRPAALGHLIARGGKPGKGNPTFVGPGNRSPKFATRGYDGERISLALELRLLADVGLVGLPNAGKSTLLLALTGGRANTKVADYAFTTLNPVVGVVRCGADGTFEGERRVLGGPDDIGSAFDAAEDFRFTVADNPGLIEHAADNVGLGHAFLRSIERAPCLAYVVDVSGDASYALRVLRGELEAYRPGMSAKVRMVLANKADLLIPSASAPGEADPSPAADDVAAARARLADLQALVAAEFGGIPVVPVSAAHSQNLRKVVAMMRGYVQEARDAALEPATTV